MTGDYFEDAVLTAMLAWPGARVQHFFFEGKPIPLGRQISKAVGGPFGKKVINFSPKKNVNAKAAIYSACLTRDPIRFKPPYHIALKFVCEPLKTVPEEFPVGASHGDLDNLEKLILDALFNETVEKKRPVVVYSDDRHIVSCLKFKRLPAAGEKPGIHFWMVKP